MRAIEIKYEKTNNIGNYEFEKIGVTIALNEGESATEALAKAKAFCCATNRNAMEMNVQQKRWRV